MRAGFTVLELLVASSLALVLAAVAVPGLRRSLDGWRLNAAARQVVMDLKAARGRAILESAPHRIRFAVPGGSYQLERQRPSGTYAAAGAPTALPAGVAVVDCTAAGAGISFRPRGHAVTFGTIVLRGDGGAERRVVVDMVGRLRVQ